MVSTFSDMRFLSRCVRLFVIAAFLLTNLPTSFAADDISSYVKPSGTHVTRGEFLQWSVRALGLGSDGKCDLPYERVPEALLPTLCAAEKNGALKALGADLKLSTALTRGDAIVILTELTDRSSTADISKFRDVRSATMKKAVQNAIGNRWMNPSRETAFGVSKKMNGTEVISLLQAVTGTAPRSNPSRVKIHIDMPTGGTTAPSGNSRIPGSDMLNTIWDLIQKDYLHADTLDEKEASFKTIEGLVDSLDDPYSTYMRPADASYFNGQIKGELTGIGAHIEDKGGIITVVAPLPKSPAEKAGIKAGDQLIEANENALSNIGLEKAVSFIRGEKGTRVILKIKRGSQDLTITVIRDQIIIPEVEITWHGKTVVVKIAQFGQTTDEQIRTVFSDIAKEKATGIVLDLRNNPGGLLHAADAVVSNFVPKGSIVTQVKGRTESSNEVTDADPTIDANVKMSVLVNRGSASASEIVAGALQDYKRATIIGTTTFGKGTVQELLTFKSGEALKLTIAEWLTPFGRKINSIGITPDIVVENEDQQLQRALSAVR